MREFLGKEPRRADRGSVIGRVALEGRTIHIPDVLADAEYSRWDSQRIGGFRTMLGVPLMMREGALLGAILLIRKAVKPFSSKQIEVVTTFADQAVIAINTAQMFEEVQARTKELQESLQYQTAVSDVLGVMSRSPNDIQPVIDSIAKRVGAESEGERAAALELALEALYLAKRIDKVSGEGETVYG